MLERNMNIADFDPELANAIDLENQRQEHHIELCLSLQLNKYSTGTHHHDVDVEHNRTVSGLDVKHLPTSEI